MQIVILFEYYLSMYLLFCIQYCKRHIFKTQTIARNYYVIFALFIETSVILEL